MQHDLPGLARPLTMADLLRRLEQRAPVALPPATPEPPAQALRIPQPRRIAASGWHRHELAAIGGYELRSDGRAIVRVRRQAAGFVVRNIGAGHDSAALDAAGADAMAARIARLYCLP